MRRVLRLYKVKRDGLGYYLDAARIEVERGEAVGRYLGSLAAALGLEGLPADRATLPALLAGVDPATGEILSPGHERVRVLAYDCTFAAPKSVSLLALLDGESPAVLEAHRRSVAAALGYLEREGAVVRRRPAAGAAVLPASGLAAAAFLHRTSRSNDPHLHSHVLVANLAAPAGGAYSALDGRGLYEHAGTAGALYRCALRHELSRELGVVWREQGRGFNDLSGFPQHALAAFSRRSGEIAEELSRHGGGGRGAVALAAERTRAEKDRTLGAEELAGQWSRRGAGSGIAASDLQRLRAAGAPPVAATEAGPAAARSAAGFPGRFTRDELVRATCAALPRGAAVAAVEGAVDELLADGPVVRLGEGGRRHGAARAIPAARIVPSYLNREAARLHAENRDRLAGAAELPGGALPGPGLYRVADFASLARLSAAPAAARLSGFAPTAGLAAHLEALSGVESAHPAGARPAEGPLVVFGPQQFTPAALHALLARSSRLPVLVLDREAPVGAGLLPAGREPPRLERVGEVRVLRAAGPEELLAVFERVRSAATRDGVVAVSADPALAGAGCVPPQLVVRSLRAAPAASVVVLGPARLLGGGLGRVEDRRRLHLVVAQPTGGGVLEEIAAPRSLVSRLGAPALDPAARARWRRAALAEWSLAAPARERPSPSLVAGRELGRGR